MKPELKKTLTNYSLNITILILLTFSGFMIYSIFTNNSPVGNTKTDITDTSKKSFPQVSSKSITVEVLNGTGEKKIAASVREFLIFNEFDVVKADNYKTSTIEKTTIIDRVGDLKKASKVAIALGVNEKLVSTQLMPELYTDVTVIIGRDFNSLKPFISNK